jgi:very-short-patch-repair endonuclease
MGAVRRVSVPQLLSGSRTKRDVGSPAKADHQRAAGRGGEGARREGVGVVAQYGCSGYLIDFVAKHPTQPGRMVLAIECDGASYHASPTARDRDRLRQDHLERLGWSFHRIWSTSWFRDKPSEIRRAVQTYEAAVQRSEGPYVPLTRPPSNAERESNGAVIQQRARPAVPPGAKINEYSYGQLREVVEWIRSDTLLRTEDQLLTEVMRELGFQKRGKRIVEAVAVAIRGS